MPPKTRLTFSFAFGLLLLIELLAGTVLTEVEWLHFVSKPAIMISLLIAFVSQRQNAPKRIRAIMIVAILFCLAGDVLLMFQNASPLFFLLGLVAFLLGHVSYILVFLIAKNPALESSETEKTARLPIFLFLGIALPFAVGLYLFIYDGLGDMKVPVIVYELVIMTMAFAALLRRKRTNKLSFGLVFAGALFFVSSDTLLAINKFHSPLPLSHIWIMATYAIAQFLIVIGILEAETE